MTIVMPNAETYKYDDLAEQLRLQIICAWQEVITNSPAAFMFGKADAFYATAERLLLEEFGMPYLTGFSRTSEEEVCNFFLETKDIKKCLTVRLLKSFLRALVAFPMVVFCSITRISA